MFLWSFVHFYVPIEHWLLVDLKSALLIMHLTIFIKVSNAYSRTRALDKTLPKSTKCKMNSTSKIMYYTIPSFVASKTNS